MTLEGVLSGTFTMGSHRTWVYADPRHEVTLNEPYWIGQTEVTQAQYLTITGDDPAYNKGDDFPVEVVTISDARYFCRKLTESQRAAGHLSADFEFGIPSEAQWERAALFGSTNAYDDVFEQMGWNTLNEDGKSAPVESGPGTASGLYGMYGNVWELCRDPYGAYPSEPQYDPEGAVQGTFVVVRGGNKNLSPAGTRSEVRNSVSPWNGGLAVGFRGVLQPVRPWLAVQTDLFASVSILDEAGRMIRTVDGGIAQRLPLRLKRGQSYELRVTKDGCLDHVETVVADWDTTRWLEIELEKVPE